MKVKLNSPEDISDFVNACGKFSGVHTSVTYMSRTVDGRSLMGIIGFGTGKELRVDIITQDAEAEAEAKLTAMLQKFAI